jgi:hypothetical protein
MYACLIKQSTILEHINHKLANLSFHLVAWMKNRLFYFIMIDNLIYEVVRTGCP